MVSPLRVEAWQRYLAHHPDAEFAQYLLKGMAEGFRIGFDRAARCCSARRNLRSTREHQEVVDAYLEREVQLRRVLRMPMTQGENVPDLQVSPIGVIPKCNRPDKWRLIVDLSSPEGQSMNAGLDRAQCSIRYTSVDMASQIISQLGAGTQLAKLDLKDAYRIVPVHPGDRPLLGMQWKKTLYVDVVLPFGLRSAPKIFSAVADGLMWIMHSNGALPSLHYLDDYLLLGRPATNDSGEALRTVLSLCEELGIPVAPEKTEGPVYTNLSGHRD